MPANLSNGVLVLPVIVVSWNTCALLAQCLLGVGHGKRHVYLVAQHRRDGVAGGHSVHALLHGRDAMAGIVTPKLLKRYHHEEAGG